MKTHGKHLAISGGRWSRRRVTITAAITVLLMAATAATAVWLVQRSTADSSFSVEATGSVDIGTLEAAHIISGGDPIFTPGETVEQCVRVSATAAAGTFEDLRLFAAVTNPTGVADYLALNLEADVDNAGVLGYANCADASWLGGVDYPLATFPTDFTTGIQIAPVADTGRDILIRLQFTLDAATPVGVAGQAASALFTFELAP